MPEEITIEKAEKFFLNEDTRVAGNLAGILLEQSVQKLCAFHQVPLSNSPSTRGLLDLLRDADAISKEKHRELQNLVSIRNKCAHATPITREEVQTLIRGTKAFIRLVESQPSTASAKPFASQHSQDIHAADVLYLSRLYAQPLTKNAQTAKPAEPSLLCLCSNCGHHNKLQLYNELPRRFCSRCGSPLNQCKTCGNHNPITSHFCMRCGHS